MTRRDTSLLGRSRDTAADDNTRWNYVHHSFKLQSNRSASQGIDNPTLQEAHGALRIAVSLVFVCWWSFGHVVHSVRVGLALSLRIFIAALNPGQKELHTK